MSFGPPRSAMYGMANRLLAGQLAARLEQFRGEGLSFDAIARELFAEAGVGVSGSTVARWCAALGIEAAA